MSNLHFFTEVDLLHTQQANEAFGPDVNKADLSRLLVDYFQFKTKTMTIVKRAN